MIVYIVTVDGKVSQEAYSTIEKAQEFVYKRANIQDWEQRKAEKSGGYVIVEEGGVRYEIHDVIVKT